MKCPKCQKDAAVHRAEVRTCPDGHGILEANDLFKLLEGLKFSNKVIDTVRKEYAVKRLVMKISPKKTSS